MSETRQSVAIIGTGMAGLITSYIMRTDSRFDVEVFEKVGNPSPCASHATLMWYAASTIIFRLSISHGLSWL